MPYAQLREKLFTGVKIGCKALSWAYGRKTLYEIHPWSSTKLRNPHSFVTSLSKHDVKWLNQGIKFEQVYLSSRKTELKILTGQILGAMKQGQGTCSMFQSFLVILPNVPARTTFIELYSLFWYVQ